MPYSKIRRDEKITDNPSGARINTHNNSLIPGN